MILSPGFNPSSTAIWFTDDAPNRTLTRVQCCPSASSLNIVTAEMLLDRTGLVAEATFLDHVAVVIDDAVPADLVSQIDADGLAHLLRHFAKLLHGWFLLCTSSSAFISLTADQVSQPSHPICPGHFARMLTHGGSTPTLNRHA